MIFWAFRREKRMLKAGLEALGIDPNVFSEKCLTDLIELGASPIMRQTMGLDQAIGGIAANVAWVCFGSDGYTAAEIRAAIERGFPDNHVAFFWEVLAKHDPKRFALDELGTTQSINRLLEAEKDRSGDPA
ncbi:MAG: hypothetical protein WBD95_09010 [Xanthobacteraceae bacterium]